MTTSYPGDDNSLSSIRIRTDENRLRLFVGQGGYACCARQGETRQGPLQDRSGRR